MTGNEFQKAMNMMVCMPATMKQMSNAEHNMTVSMKDGVMMMKKLKYHRASL